VSLSSDVLPQIKEFERVSTTIVNAYVARLWRITWGDSNGASPRPVTPGRP